MLPVGRADESRPRLDRFQVLIVQYSSRVLDLIECISRRKVLSCVLAGFLAMAIRLAVLPFAPMPQPAIHDEFSYLLGADTFASGRLTNPPHPMWVHFETFHVNFQPTYATKYPPLQSLFLALGQKVLGHPWFGVWLSFGLMCTCLCWMLQGWMSPANAFLGTLVGMGQIGIFGYWMNSYWGGAVPAVGGCLVLGALPRLAHRATVPASLLGSLGLIVLANSRPYEGLLMSLAAAGGLLWLRRRQGRGFVDLLAPRTLAPAVLVCGLAATGMAYYNYRVTGNPVLMPYTVNQRLYSAVPVFYALQMALDPVYRHENIRKYWQEWVKGAYLKRRANPLLSLRWYITILPFYFSPLSGFMFLAVGLLAKSVKVRIALAIFAVTSFGLLVIDGVQEHYLAPATGLVFIPVMYGVRWLRARSQPFGPFMAVLFVALVFGAGLLGVFRLHEQTDTRRQGVIHELMHEGGRHLVIVRYSASHDLDTEYVYNRADIDGSPIVWAQDMGEEKNRELLDYYRGRKVWLLQPDPSPGLTPYRAW